MDLDVLDWLVWVDYVKFSRLDRCSIPLGDTTFVEENPDGQVLHSRLYKTPYTTWTGARLWVEWTKRGRLKASCCLIRNLLLTKGEGMRM